MVTMRLCQFYSIIGLIVIGIQLCQSSKVKCYRCTNCPIPFQPELATELSNCNFCRTVLNYDGTDEPKIQKDCVSSCVAIDRRKPDNRGLVTECCSEDLCNATSSIPYLGKYGLLSVLTMLALIRKYIL